MLTKITEKNGIKTTLNKTVSKFNVPYIEIMISEVPIIQETETLIALGICSATNDMIKKALSNISKLNGCDAHATYIVTNGDKTSLKKLNINLTCESNYKDNLE